MSMKNLKKENSKMFESLERFGFKVKINHIRCYAPEIQPSVIPMHYVRKGKNHLTEIECKVKYQLSPRGGMTRVSVLGTGDQEIACNEAICSPKENYCFAKGLHIALGRVMKDLRERGLLPVLEVDEEPAVGAHVNSEINEVSVV